MFKVKTLIYNCWPVKLTTQVRLLVLTRIIENSYSPYKFNAVEQQSTSNDRYKYVKVTYRDTRSEGNWCMI